MSTPDPGAAAPGAVALSDRDLKAVVSRLIADGVAVHAPVVRDGRSERARISDPDDITLEAPLPLAPLKALFLPPTEPLFHWMRDKQRVVLREVATSFSPAVVFGVRPCDAAALDILDRVMNWDYRDELWFGRREATTIISLACAAPGDDCFCREVGLGPASTRGSDLLMTHTGAGFEIQAVTEKGAALADRYGIAAERVGPGPDRRPMPEVHDWLAAHFDDPLWNDIALRCHGCGACASVCPTCHCFDIVDEPEGLLAGTRRRNWDTCQASKFTLHASGHNPRADQGARFRQRVMHKFRIYPERFGEVLCTGCGRCARACPAGQNLREILVEMGS